MTRVGLNIDGGYPAGGNGRGKIRNFADWRGKALVRASEGADRG
jgi:hypothetical protein